MLKQRTTKGVRAGLRPKLLAAGVAAAALLAAGSASAQLKTTEPPLKHVAVDITDHTAVRNGAMIFMHQCLACHSLQGMRFDELENLTDLSAAEVNQYLRVSDRSMLDTIVSPMPADLAQGYFGTEPPDLTYEIHLRGADWLYTYFTSFYADPDRPTGANNVVFHNVAMPNVFAGMQGLQEPVRAAGFRQGQPAQIAMSVKPLTTGSMTPEQFDATAKDLVTFIEYAGEPHKPLRHAIGRWVLAITALWTILMYIVYRMYWRDVKHPEGPRWPAYWKKK